MNNDTCRCQDAECPDNVICTRWTNRTTGRSTQATFREPDVLGCRGLIPDWTAPLLDYGRPL